jgi:TATA-box binding protein (TBP) (component of TFIID and TFIIIB)
MPNLEHTLTDEDIYTLKQFKPYTNSRLSNADVGFPVSQNIVCTLPMMTELDLSKLAAKNAVSVKTPDFSASTFRFEKMGTVQAFGKGNCVVVGCSSMAGVYLLSHTLRLSLNRQGIPAKQGRILMRNRVCNGDVGFPIDIKNFKYDTLGMVFLDKLFPGIVFFINTEDGVRIFLIFGSGNFIVMGLQENRDEQAHKAYEYILPVLMKNRLEHSSETEHINKSIQKLKRRIIKDMQRDDIMLSRSCSKETLMNYLKMVVLEETMIEGLNEEKGEGRKRPAAHREKENGGCEDDENSEETEDVLKQEFIKLTKMPRR